MPTIVNTSGVKAGCVYRIKLENFVTFKNVELYPGLSLNMIIGPNGTGKSTFVSALVLGLCGNIASIGRSKKISEYIRADCEEATIEIDLYQERGKPNVKITRVFNQKEMSKWYIDNKLVSQKNVKDLISSFNIQVDNLCQVLPQDRVKDFANMKPHTLLQSTLSAIGEQKRVEQLEKLKKWRSEQCSLGNKLQKNEKKKQELIDENKALQDKINVLNRKKELENEIKVCNSKKLWLEAAILKREAKKYDKEKKEVDELVNSNREKVRPLQEAMQKVKAEIKQLEQEKRALNVKINDLKDRMNDSFGSIKIQNDKIKEAHSWYLEMEKRRASEAKDLEETKAKLNRLQVDLAQAMKKYGDEPAMNAEVVKVRNKIGGLENKKIALTQQRHRIEYDFEHTLFPEMAQCRSKINALKDVDRKRLQTLERHSSDTYKALQWLRANRHNYEWDVCEPMMLEIKFSEARFARYLESTVARRDLVAFTFVNTGHMNEFLQKVRQELGLKEVNAICSPPNRNIYESSDINALRQYGFQTYLLETFTANEMIVRYLCRNYNVHNIPIGNDFTYNNSGRVPSNISFFFSENHRFSVKVSRYTGDASTSITEIRSPFLLADTVDVDKINHWTNKLSALEKDEQTYRNNRRTLDSQLEALETEYNGYVATQTALQEHAHLLRRLASKIRSQEAIVEERSQPSLNLEEEKEKCAIEQRKCVQKQIQLHTELTEIVANLHTYAFVMDLLSMGLGKKRNSTVDQERELDGLKKKLSEAQERLSAVQKKEEQSKQKAADKLKEALRSTDNRSPEHPQFPQRETFERLPSALQQLQDHCNELITKMNCMSDSDETDLQTYEKNKKAIEQLMTEETALRGDNKKLETTMAKMKVEWVQFVKQLIVDINQRFRAMFATLNFGGEVQLKQGTCEEDFASYGVAIKVKFRAGEQLRDLTPYEQSGGERSISTAVYLFTLQHLVKAPFRCVDEINQGMDSRNERMMFEFLVKVTTEGDRGQYFLLTPKLLTDLAYNENVMVHTIMNGRGAMTYDQWQLDRFIANVAVDCAT